MSANGTCTACPAGLYQDSGSHRSRTCKEQNQCGMGHWLDGASGISAGSCMDCPAGKFKNTGANRGGCSDQSVCGSGQWLDGASSTSGGTCKNCPTGKFKSSGANHDACSNQNTCASGQWLDGASSASAGACKDCPAGKFKSISTRMLHCLDTRQRGTWHFAGIAVTWVDAVQLCSGYKYMSVECPTDAGFEVFCLNAFQTTGDYPELDHAECMGHPAAQRVTGGTNGHCTGYPRGDFKHGDRVLGGAHRGALYALNDRNACSDQNKTCGSGQWLDGASNSSAGACKDCPTGKYKHLPHGTDRNGCGDWQQCGRGQALRHANATMRGVCSSCHAGQYQDSDSHRLQACKDQSVCESGQ
eukprot:g8191.t1